MTEATSHDQKSEVVLSKFRFPVNFRRFYFSKGYAMSYKKDFIDQLKQSGEWDNYSTEQKKILEMIDDDMARTLMVLFDDVDVKLFSDRAVLSNPNSPEAQQLVNERLTKGWTNQSEVFGGLMTRDGDKFPLTPMGEAVAHLFQVAEQNGYSMTAAIMEMGKLSIDGAFVVTLPRKAR